MLIQQSIKRCLNWQCVLLSLMILIGTGILLQTVLYAQNTPPSSTKPETAVNNSPVANLTVILESAVTQQTVATTLTNANGMFSFTNLSNGKYVVKMKNNIPGTVKVNALAVTVSCVECSPNITLTETLAQGTTSKSLLFTVIKSGTTITGTLKTTTLTIRK